MQTKGVLANAKRNQNKKRTLQAKTLRSNDCGHCEDELQVDKKNPDHTSALARLKKVKGQITGLEKMINDGRYCVDILIQFRAIIAGLSAIEAHTFERHIRGCVQDAIGSHDDKEIEIKINELMKLISKRLY